MRLLVKYNCKFSSVFLTNTKNLVAKEQDSWTEIIQLHIYWKCTFPINPHVRRSVSYFIDWLFRPSDIIYLKGRYQSFTSMLLAEHLLLFKDHAKMKLTPSSSCSKENCINK